MAVEAKDRKPKKIFQIAKELNLGFDTIKEFLEKKGTKVTNPNMRIPFEVYEQLLDRFSYEKKEAEKIQARRDERTREEEEDVVVEETPEAVEAEDVPVETPVEEEIAEAPVEEEAPVEPEEAPVEEAEEVEEEPVEEEAPAEVEPAEEVAEEPVDEEPVEEAPVEVAEPEATEPEVDVVETTEAVVEEVVEPLGIGEEQPKVGDIITDHPMAKQFLERQKREAEERAQRAEEKKSGKAKAKAKAAPAKAGEATEEDDKKRGKKKTRKEDREARRKKAFEMLRQEGRKSRPSIPAGGDDDSSSTSGSPGRRKRKKKKVDQKEVDDALKKTLASMSDSGGGRKKRKKIRTEEGVEEEIEVNVVKVTEFITANDLANLMDVSTIDIIRKCLELGLVVTINQRLDMDTISLLAAEFDYEVEQEEEFGSDFIEEAADEEDDPKDLLPRSPVVTVMGHVDHGKTSLLDYVRKANVADGESGGITQHIGAYQVQMSEGRSITFLDTPGHEAFTAMRARGAQVTDIVILVIAADDKVMPQTEEALDHAKAAGVSIVIAINKMDKPGADSNTIKKQLADRNILVEDWGGTFQCVEVSAKTGDGVDDLLEKVLLEAELLDLKANPNKRSRGVVVEARLDKGKGPVANVLISAGTLNVGDSFVVGQINGKVRAMFDDKGKRIKQAGPSVPVQVLGLDGVPEAGDRFIGMEDEREARDVAQRRQQLKREQDFRQVRLMTLDELSKQVQQGNLQELKLVVKADVDGSAQALADSLQRLSTNTIEVQVIRRAVGPIAESDVILAAASNAIIIGFHVRPSVKAKELADREKVDIRQYKVIYDAIEEVEAALEGMLQPIEREVLLGTVEVRQLFKISRLGTVAGSMVLSGKVTRNSLIRVVRNDVEIYSGKLSSLKREKDDAKEVNAGFECGLMIERYNDLREGDIIEAYEVVQEAQTLKQDRQGAMN
ncbi:MAG: translation initiation factor IF-2 [Calditrichia bacterium]